jgi:hypothetical protein
VLAASFTFLTPQAAVLGVLALLPPAAFVIGGRRADAVRQILRLPPAPQSGRYRRIAAVAGIVLLLTLATMQPVVKTNSALRSRTDAQLFVVLDTSRSMAAAPSPSGLTRLARAERLALDLGSQLGDLPVGIATFTDRILPDLFPTPDRAAFDSVASSVRVEDPPPQQANTVATTFDALTSLATNGFFSDNVHKRVVVVLTDGESVPFDPGAVASTLAHHGVRLKVIRIGTGSDRVWTRSGKPEAGYRPDPTGARLDVARLESALGNPTRQSAAAFVRSVVGSGPSESVGVQPHTATLAPVPAVIALVLLIVVFGSPRTAAATVPAPVRQSGARGRTREEPDTRTGRRRVAASRRGRRSFD